MQNEADNIAHQRSIELSASSSNGSINGKTPFIHIQNLNIPMFDNKSESLDAHLNRLETLLVAYQIPRNLWSLELSKSHKEEALDVYNRLIDKADYDQLAEAIRSPFGVTCHKCRSLFKTSKPAVHERLNNFAIRLQTYFTNWLEKTSRQKTYSDLSDLIIMDQFYRSLDKVTQVFVRESGILTLPEMIKKAQDYRDAHYSENKASQNGKKPDFKYRSKTESPKTTMDRNNNHSNDYRPTAEKDATYQNKSFDKTKSENKSEVVCWDCQGKGHTSKSPSCPKNRQQKGNEKSKSAACLEIDNADTQDLFPVVSATEKSYSSVKNTTDLRMPLKVKCLVNNIPTQFLRDSGSSVCLVRYDLVEPNSFTG